MARVDKGTLLEGLDLPRREPDVISPPIPGHRESVALRKLGNPDGFWFYRWECIDHGSDVMLTGCVVTKFYTKGKKKGRPIYDGVMRRAVVTDAEFKAERVRYEQETGNCGACMGTGQVFKSWDHMSGTEYRGCHVCGSSGRLKSPESVDAVDPVVGVVTE